jgi:hypothetical protein
MAMTEIPLAGKQVDRLKAEGKSQGNTYRLVLPGKRNSTTEKGF